MNRYSRLIRQCAWCQRLCGTSAPTEPNCTGITHTICEACATRRTTASGNRAEHPACAEQKERL